MRRGLSLMRDKIGSAVWFWPVLALTVVAICGQRWNREGAIWAAALMLTFTLGVVLGVLSATTLDASGLDPGNGGVDRGTAPTPSEDQTGRTVLRDARLDGAQMQNADLRGADLRGASLVGADLRGANLDGADMGHNSS